MKLYDFVTGRVKILELFRKDQIEKLDTAGNILYLFKLYRKDMQRRKPKQYPKESTLNNFLDELDIFTNALSYAVADKKQRARKLKQKSFQRKIIL